MGMAQLSRQFVPRATGGNFLDDIGVSVISSQALLQLIRNEEVASGTNLAAIQFRSHNDTAGTINYGTLQVRSRGAATGAARGEFVIRAQNGGGGQRDMLIASGQTEDGGGAIAMKTKAGALVAGDVPLECIMPADDGTDIGIYLNDGGVLKKLQSSGLFT